MVYGIREIYVTESAHHFQATPQTKVYQEFGEQIGKEIVFVLSLWFIVFFNIFLYTHLVHIFWHQFFIPNVIFHFVLRCVCICNISSVLATLFIHICTVFVFGQ